MLDVEVWSDSFREGEWLVDTVLSVVPHGKVEVSYEFGFRPIYEIQHLGAIQGVRAQVYGDYKAWRNIPKQIAELLEYGKPDIVMYSKKEDIVLLSVEETAAVPTGNQSLQRLERVWYAATKGIPFAYLMGEYGLHKDGGVRRTSIWPAYLSIKLSSQFRCPSIVLTYGDKERHDDYSVGSGLKQTGEFVYLRLAKWSGLDVRVTEKSFYKDVYRHMCNFVLDQMEEIARLSPGRELLHREDFAEFLADRVTK